MEVLNALDDLPDKIAVPHNTKDLNFCVFAFLTRICKLKTKTKHISIECQ